MPSAVLLLLLVAAAAADTDYCAIETCGNAQEHTMCQYNSTGAAPSCGEVRERGVSAADQQEILEAHNTIRQMVKSGVFVDNNLPIPESMPNLTWDSELATVAQRWADQCASGHDRCRDVPRFRVGQNTMWINDYIKSWSVFVRFWFFRVVSDFKQHNLTYVSGQGTQMTQMTQIIWGATNTTGCGFIGVRDNTANAGSNNTARTYVCNYGPAGNVPGQNIYEKYLEDG